MHALSYAVALHNRTDVELSYIWDEDEVRGRGFRDEEKGKIALYLSALIRPPHGTVRQRWREKIALSLSARNGNQHGLVFIMRNDCIRMKESRKTFII